MDKAMRNRNLLGSLAVASLLLSGCAAAVGAPGTAPGTSADSQTTDSQTATVAPASTSPAASQSVSAASTRGPSEASKMICNDETKGDISQILGLTSAPR